MRIAVIGLGVVAISDALSLAREHDVIITGPLKDRIEAINVGAFPLADPSVPEYVARNMLSLYATLDTDEALQSADLILVATPLEYSAKRGDVSTFELEAWVEYAHQKCPGVPIVIRSAVPIGFTKRVREGLKSRSITCAPEFFREGHSLQDALAPKAIVVGDRGTLGTKVGAILLSASLRQGVEIRMIGASEAEAVKHFSQAYIAARVAYFNELDSYAMAKKLDSRQVIDGVCLDPRIGTFANNPCFGLGGERVPRSMVQLDTVCGTVPSHVLPNIATSHDARIEFLVSKVLEKEPRTIGIYYSKEDSSAQAPLSALQERLVAAGANVRTFTGRPVMNDAGFEVFKDDCDIVLAQRITPELQDIRAKVFSRDLYAAPLAKTMA